MLSDQLQHFLYLENTDPKERVPVEKRIFIFYYASGNLYFAGRCGQCAGN